jgi:integration host factor subunit alpha
MPVNEASKMTLTKADIVEQVFEKVGLTKKEATDVVEFVFDSLKGQLQKGEKVKISGFGNFIVRQKKARVGRNPQTGEEMTITARSVLTFKPSQVLRAMLNKDLPKTSPEDTAGSKSVG